MQILHGDKTIPHWFWGGQKNSVARMLTRDLFAVAILTFLQVDHLCSFDILAFSVLGVWPFFGLDPEIQAYVVQAPHYCHSTPRPCMAVWSTSVLYGPTDGSHAMSGKLPNLKSCNNCRWKTRSDSRKHCALAVVGRRQKFSPRRRPPSRGRGTAKNLISWR